MDRSQLLRDIQCGQAIIGLKPTKTIDKSRPIVLAEGEQLKTYSINKNENIPSPPPPPPPPAPIPSGSITKPIIPKSNNYTGMAKRASAAVDRDALLNDIRQGVKLRKVSREDDGVNGSIPTDPIQKRTDSTDYSEKPCPIPPPAGPPAIPNFLAPDGDALMRKVKSENCLSDSFDDELKKVVVAKQKEKQEFFDRMPKRIDKSAVSPLEPAMRPTKSENDLSPNRKENCAFNFKNSGIGREMKNSEMPEIVITADMGKMEVDRDAMTDEIRRGVRLRKISSAIDLSEGNEDPPKKEKSIKIGESQKSRSETELVGSKFSESGTKSSARAAPPRPSVPALKISPNLAKNYQSDPEDTVSNHPEPPSYPPPPPPTDFFLKKEMFLNSGASDRRSSSPNIGSAKFAEKAPKASKIDETDTPSVFQRRNDSSGYMVRPIDPRPNRSFDLGRSTRAPNFGALRQHFESNSKASQDQRRASTSVVAQKSASRDSSSRDSSFQKPKFFIPPPETKSDSSEYSAEEKKLAAQRLGTFLKQKMDQEGRDETKMAQLINLPMDDLKNFHFSIDLNDRNGDIIRIEKRCNK